MGFRLNCTLSYLSPHGNAETLSFTVFCVCLSVCVLPVGHAVKEIDKFGSRYLVQGFWERDEFGSLIEEFLLYITTQIGELWHRGSSPWGMKILKVVKTFLMLFSYIVWISVMKFGIIRALVHSKSSPILVNFGLLFREHTFSTADILGTFCHRVTKFGMVRGLANRHLLTKFGELWSAGYTIPCGNMHQSFTDALVCYYPLYAYCYVLLFVWHIVWHCCFSMRKILFVEKSEHYFKLDNWPPESERR